MIPDQLRKLFLGSPPVAQFLGVLFTGPEHRMYSEDAALPGRYSVEAWGGSLRQFDRVSWAPGRLHWAAIRTRFLLNNLLFGLPVIPDRRLPPGWVFLGDPGAIYDPHQGDLRGIRPLLGPPDPD